MNDWYYVPSGGGSRQYHTVYDMIRFDDLDAGVVRIYENLHDDYVADILLELAYLQRSADGPIRVEIMSDGGSVNASFALYDMLKSFPKGVEILARGVCASAAVMIVLQAGTVRKATPNARFLLHEPSAWIEGKKSSIEDELNEIKRLSDKIVDLLAERCGKTREEVKELIDRKEVWMSAEEALTWGLIDEIVK